MKFEELLMLPRDDRRRRLDLQEEVEELQERLDGELRLNSALRWAINGGPLLSSPELLPFKVQLLLTELAMVEEEILCLERNVRRLKHTLFQHKDTKDCETKLLLVAEAQEKDKYKSSFDLDLELNLASPEPASSSSNTSCKSLQHRTRPSVTTTFINIEDRSQGNTQSIPTYSSTNQEPNRISEELLRSLVSLFLKISKASQLPTGPGSAVTKHSLSCITSRGFPTKSPFTCKVRPSISNDSILTTTVDPWDAAAYKGYTHITRSSLNKGYTSDCKTLLRRIRVLLQKLCDVDLAFLTYKQKLAFWINVYNACIMNAYLQHGLPSTQERMLSLMNKAVLNVGGIVLNALAIEHYVLRHPHDSKHDVADEKELLLRRAYGLRYPEPNLTFALCRGNWSSPALKVYSPEEVVNQLERAKIDYLEASVGVRSKKKILIPKLLQWHMHDFADDLESLIEWIYSQLPQSGALKKRIMECLNAETDPIRNMVEIVPYEYEFRYLLPTPMPTLTPEMGCLRAESAGP